MAFPCEVGDLHNKAPAEVRQYTKPSIEEK